jgi:hypothetical protein
MATIILSSYVIRYPVGGVLSNNLQFLTGFRRLGHEVYLVEKAGYDESCFDPERRVSSDDCGAGVRLIAELLDAHGLGGRWCYVAADGGYHGMTREEVDDVFDRADLFIDRGLHQTWDEEADGVAVRVLLDPDPGLRQVRLDHARAKGRALPAYDAYYTYGHNIGTPRSHAPTAGLTWRHVFHPIDTALYRPHRPVTSGRCTTIMNWHALDHVVHDGEVYGMKDVQFPRYEGLPRLVEVPMEVAVEGPRIPRQRLTDAGWHVVSALDVTATYESYLTYITSSLAEFSVVKDVYHRFNVGWFSDRSAAYLAHGRPVVVQDNGIADHLPVGEGLFEVADQDQAADAIARIAREPERHAQAARCIAEEHLDARVVLKRFLGELGVGSPTPGAVDGPSAGGRP